MPDRTRDLIEMAAFIYAADRLITRGRPNQVEFENWARELTFCIPVRDLTYWQQDEVVKSLASALTFVSGDKSYSFYFTKRISTDPPTSLFHDADTAPDSVDLKSGYPVALFSGGLDFLAGVVSLLATTDKKVVITSHRSNPSTVKVQKRVYEALNRAYPGRLLYHPLECSLTGVRASEETQRTRFFLYTAVGFALAQAYGQDELNIFENGITSINLSKRQDLMNGRASRTTHPKTLGLLQKVFAGVLNHPFIIRHPFIHLTKTEVVSVLKQYNQPDLIGSTLTCTKTFEKFNNRTSASHCGYCSQCVDRRFAMYAAKLEKYDTVYDFDLATEAFPKKDAQTHVIDYMRHAHTFATTHFDEFYNDYLDPLSDLIEFIPNEHIEEEVTNLHQLYLRHAGAVERAYRRMVDMHDSIFKPPLANSIYEVVNARRFQRDRAECLAADIARMLNTTIPIALASITVGHENALNDQIQALLRRDSETYEREYPAVRFSFATVVPDHSSTSADADLFIEAKFLRKKTPPSVITDQIAADLMKYPDGAYKLFVIYDPERRIKEDNRFKRDFEIRSNCTICIIR
ncbi:7-cyano-7-deazaguanine synthase [Spirosoma sp. BT702]|uniref:7-cyano-7-deazaguanine synthase n=1 Tax=Spirosoma profusum TaxID=2771354 RepID=A0A926Y3G1_9BACT|nr:7-cyano-7-deazaguanine synthase [Spirosoma profusum]MBD2701855.1 7-cyano-7-deazaguanine synthase [Spirosoma profusum]